MYAFGALDRITLVSAELNLDPRRVLPSVYFSSARPEAVVCLRPLHRHMGHDQSKGKPKAEPKPRADRAQPPSREPAPAEPTAAPHQVTAAAATTGGFAMGAPAAPDPISHFLAEIDPTSFLSLLPRDLQKVRASRSGLLPPSCAQCALTPSLVR